jgi:hypothetical protein
MNWTELAEDRGISQGVVNAIKNPPGKFLD